MLTKILKQVINGEELTPCEMAAAIDAMVDSPSPIQTAALLAALESKGITAGELVGAVRAMERRARSVDLGSPLYDIVGTGGDGAGLVNISTPAAIVVAASGLQVAKHGNRAISSRCGAADLLEALGISVDLAPERSVEEAGIAFLYAPHYHPSFAKVREVRRTLGVRNLFHLLGPLLNPAKANRLLLGVCDEDLLPLYAEAVRQLPIERALIFCGMGCDELTPLGPSHGRLVAEGEIRELVLDPREVGCPPCGPSDLQGGGADLNGPLVMTALEGRQGALFDAILMTAGAALMLEGLTFAEGVERARRAVLKGDAIRTVERWRACAAFCKR